MLRASSETHDESINLEAVMAGGAAGEIEFATELLAFAEAIVSGEDHTIAIARDQLVKTAGQDVMVDAAGVASNFQRMVRIADSTGIVLGPMAEVTSDLRESLGINSFANRPSV